METINLDINTFFFTHKRHFQRSTIYGNQILHTDVNFLTASSTKGKSARILGSKTLTAAGEHFNVLYKGNHFNAYHTSEWIFKGVDEVENYSACKVICIT